MSEDADKNPPHRRPTSLPRRRRSRARGRTAARRSPTPPAPSGSSCARRRSPRRRCSRSPTSWRTARRSVRSPSCSTAVPAPRPRTCTWVLSGRPGSTSRPTDRCPTMPPQAGHERIVLARLHRPRLRRPGRHRLQPRDRERQARGGQGQGQGRRRPARPQGVLRDEARPRVALRVHGPLALDPWTVGLTRRDRRRELRWLPCRPARADAPGDRRDRTQRRDPDLPGTRDHPAQPHRLRRRRVDRHAADDGGSCSPPRALPRVLCRDAARGGARGSRDVRDG